MSSPTRFPTVEEEEDGEEIGTSTGQEQQQRDGQEPRNTSGSRAGELMSTASRRRQSSQSSTPSSGMRFREGSEGSVRSWTRRDSLAPSQAAQERLGSVGGRLNASPRSSTGARSDENEQTEDTALATTPTVHTEERLLNFEKVVSTDTDGEERGSCSRLDKVLELKNRAMVHQPALRMLRDWGKDMEDFAAMTQADLIPFLKAWLHRAFQSNDHRLPADNQLISLAHYYYPPIGQIPVEVCDFGPGRAQHFTTNLGRIQKCWEEKPFWATVRWIHAPLGVGILHSSVEDLFLHAGPKGKAFHEAGGIGFPFLQTELMELQSREFFQTKRDVCVLLKRLPRLSSQLDESLFSGDENEALLSDVKWRVGHLGVKLNYWNVEQSDMARQLSEGLSLGMEGPHSGLKPIDRTVDPQMISRHPFYRHSQLVKNPFRCFHRADGCLLTLSPGAGINYLDKDLSRYLSEPSESMFSNPKASVVGNVWKMFSETGTKSWHRESIEWFTVFLMTEMITTPHGICQGFNAPSIPLAYQLIVQDLKRRRFDPWKRYESIRLVQDYISCSDELSGMVHVLESKMSLLKNLKKDCLRLEAEETEEPNDPLGKSIIARVDWAHHVIQEQHSALNAVFKDLSNSMQALFQLRSIEQNELAIVADSQSKAILLFTGVTIIFLPLSFFTSYFGMNLQGVVNTQRTEKYFWAVCGSVAIIMVFFTLLFAFRHKMKRLVKIKRAQQLGGFEV